MQHPIGRLSICQRSPCCGPAFCFIRPSVCPPLHHLCFLVRPSICPLHLSTLPSVHPPSHPFAYPSIHPSIPLPPALLSALSPLHPVAARQTHFQKKSMDPRAAAMCNSHVNRLGTGTGPRALIMFVDRLRADAENIAKRAYNFQADPTASQIINGCYVQAPLKYN